MIASGSVRIPGNILDPVISEQATSVWNKCYTCGLFLLLIAANKELWQFKIPQTFYCFWQPLLTGLLSRSFTQILIEKMFMELKECSDSSELRPQFLISWISEMLTGIAKVNAGEYVWNVYVYARVSSLLL